MMMGGNFRTVNPPQNPATVATTITPTASTPTARSRPRLNISSASAPAAAFISLDPLQSPSGPRSSSGENYTWIRGIGIQQSPLPLQGSSGVPRSSTMPANTLNNASSTQGRGHPLRNTPPQLGRSQQKQPRSNNNQANSTQFQPREYNLNSRGISTESQPTTPQHSRYHTPNQSRRGSSVGCVRNGSLQCHYKDCCKVFANDNDWQAHKSFCRYRNWSVNMGLQCAFVGCPVSSSCIDNQNEEDGPAISITYDSLSQLLAHEREHHQILYCLNCHFVLPSNAAEKAEEHRHKCTQNKKVEMESTSGGPVVGGMRGETSGNQGGKVCLRWVNDLQLVLNQHLEKDHGSFVDLDYPERAMEEQGKGPERVPIEDGTRNTALCEPTRTAIASQVVGNLKLQYEFLLNASVVALELKPREKDDVREYLCKIARILRFDTPPIGSNPTIALVPAPFPAEEGRQVPIARDKDELGTPAPNSGISPVRILSRSTSPPRQPVVEEPTSTESHPQLLVTTQPPCPAPTVVSPPLNQNSQGRAVFITDEGEPLLEIHIPQETQQKYYEKMMDYCLDAVYDWFTKNRDVLLRNCECTNPMPLVGENTDNGAVPSSKGKRAKKNHLDASRITYNTGSGGEGCPGTVRVRCFLHDVTCRTTHTLPRWTHHLRRLVEQNRIPPYIIANKDSFSGEIQPVDEVRHALRKNKTKTDRDLLALVQQVRKFCWQLKDWEKCKELDRLYGVLEDFIRFTKDQEMKEGWVVAKGRKGGKQKGEKRVTVGGSSGVVAKNRAQGNGGGHFRPSFTWG